MTANGDTPAEPVLLERGRYRMSEAPDGSGVLTRAVNVCDRCQECGCGEQADPIVIPPLVMTMLRTGDIGGMRAKMKAMMGRG